MKPAVVFVLLVILAALPQVALAGPRAVTKEDRIILDKPVFEGEKVSGVFEVTNEGDEALTIDKIVPG